MNILNECRHFSHIYDDTPNCTFYMHLSPVLIKNKILYNVIYFTTGGSPAVVSWPPMSTDTHDKETYGWEGEIICGRFSSPSDLLDYMNNEFLAKSKNRTARMWMYLNELWDHQLKVLNQQQ